MGARTLRKRKVGSFQRIDIGQYTIPCTIIGISTSGPSKNPTHVYKVRIVEGEIHKTTVRKKEDSRITVPGIRGAVKAVTFSMASKKVKSLPKKLLDKWKPGSLVTVGEYDFYDLDDFWSFDLGVF